MNQRGRLVSAAGHRGLVLALTVVAASLMLVPCAAAIPPVLLTTRAFAVDHVVLDISPTRIAPPLPAKASKQERARVRALGAWRLHGRVVGRDFYRPGDPEIFGVSLTRVFPNGREVHELTAGTEQTVTFDGERGRFEAVFGKTLVVRMEIVARGAPQPSEAPLPCRGTFARVAVTLRGAFVLRTGTKFFGTIRRVSLPGVVSFASGGVDCTPLPPSVCEAASTLWASTHQQRALVNLLMSPDQNGWATLSFANPLIDAPAVWYHVMEIDALARNPLSGALPTIGARLARPLPVQGSGTFTAQQTSTTTTGSCRSVSTTGTFMGTFRTQFAGWGARSATFTAADHAGYIEQRSP